VQKYSYISEIEQFSCWDILFCLTLYTVLTPSVCARHGICQRWPH